MGKKYQVIIIGIIILFVGLCVFWINSDNTPSTIEDYSICLHNNDIQLRSDYKSCGEDNQCKMDILLKVCKK